MAEFTQLSIPLARTSTNFAPIKPLQKLIQDKKPPKAPTAFDKAIKRWFDAKMAQESAAWNELYSMAQLVALFREGNQLLRRKPYGGVGYYVQPVANDDTYRQLAMNLMGFHAQVCESKVVASNPNVNMRAGDDTPQSIAAAQAARPVVDCYETEWYTSKFNRREAIDLLTNGMFIHRVRWNPFKGGMSVQERQVSQVQKQSDEGYGECAECSYAGTAADFANETCPECNSPAVDVKPPTLINLNQISMGQSRPVGEPEIMRTPFQGWRWDLSHDLEDSPWAIYRQRITNGVVNLMLGDVVIPDSNSSSDKGLDILHALAYAGQAMEGSSSKGMYGGDRTSDKQPTMAECWIPPEDMSEIPIEAGMTISGQELPAGKMSDFFHEPVCVVVLNDAAVTLGVFERESHQTEVVTGQWIMQSDSGAGRGMEDTAAVQRRFNAVDGQIYQALATTATPAVITDLRILRDDQGEYLFRPGVNIDVNLSLLPPNMKLSDAFYLGQPGNVSQQYLQYGSTFLKQMFQLSAFVTDFSDGLPGVDNRTATGAQITAQLANSLFGPMLSTKGQGRVRIAQMIVMLEAKHNVSSRYFPGKDNARGRTVNGKDLQGKVIYSLVPNSEIPTTPFSQQTDIRVMIEAMGGIQGVIMLKQSDPEMFKQLTAPFNYKHESEDPDDISTLCLERIEQMKSNLAAGMNDPKMLANSIRPPVAIIEPKHQAKAEWFSAYLDLRQGQEAEQTLRDAVVELYWLHLNCETQKKIPPALNAGIVGAAQMAPAALGQAALQQQTEQPEPAEKDDSKKIEADVAMSQADNENDLRLKDMEIKGQLAVTREQGKTQKEVTELAGENAIKVQRAKPKPKVAKAS